MRAKVDEAQKQCPTSKAVRQNKRTRAPPRRASAPGSCVLPSSITLCGRSGASPAPPLANRLHLHRPRRIVHAAVPSPPLPTPAFELARFCVELEGIYSVLRELEALIVVEFVDLGGDLWGGVAVLARRGLGLGLGLG